MRVHGYAAGHAHPRHRRPRQGRLGHRRRPPSRPATTSPPATSARPSSRRAGPASRATSRPTSPTPATRSRSCAATTPSSTPPRSPSRRRNPPHHGLPEQPDGDVQHARGGGALRRRRASSTSRARPCPASSSPSAPFLPDYAPVDEEHPIRPQDPYALAKHFGEQLMDAAVRALGHPRDLDPARRWVQWEGNYERNLGPALRDPEARAERVALGLHRRLRPRRRAAAGRRVRRSTPARGRSTSPRPTTAPTGRSRSSIRHHHGDDVELRELAREDASRDLDREGRAAARLRPARSWRDYLTEDGELLDAAARAARARRDRRPARARRARLGSVAATVGDRRLVGGGTRAGRPAPPRRRRPRRASRPRAAPRRATSSLSRCSREQRA